MERLALIDIGSNSIRMTCYKIKSATDYTEINRVREFVQLAKNMTPSGAINAQAFNLGVTVLKEFKDIIVKRKTDIVIATATEAVRQASNQAEFLQAVKDATGIQIRVLSGQEESRYDAIGLVHTNDIKDFMFLDTGGGSFELGNVVDQQLVDAQSLPYGAIKIYDQFVKNDKLNSKAQKEILDLFSSKITIGQKNIHKLIIIGGIHRAFFKVIDVTQDEWASATDVLKDIRTIQSNTLAANKNLKRMPERRAPFMPAGLMPLRFALQTYNIKKVECSRQGLRDGILFEHLDQLKKEG